MNTDNLHLQNIKAIHKKYMNMVPFNHILENEDHGFLILRAICEANGSILIGKKIAVGTDIIADKVNYRFDGYSLSVAFHCLIREKMVQKTIQIRI